MDLTTLSITEAAYLLRQRQLSPVELVRACLDKIERLDPQLNCFITRTAEEALNEAREAEMSISRGEYRGPLHGIPIAIKDLYETKGLRTTAASKFLLDNVPDKDCPVV